MTGALSLPISAYARLTALLPVKPSGLPSRSCPFLFTSNHTPWFLYHSEGKKVPRCPRINSPHHPHRPPGLSSTVSDTRGKHRTSLLTPGQESGEPAGPCSWEGSHSWTTSRAQKQNVPSGTQEPRLLASTLHPHQALTVCPRQDR